MANLPHYSNDQTSKKGRNFEPIQGNLFEVTIIPPAGIAGGEMLLQHVNSISGLETIHRPISPVEQKFKWATRNYAGMPDGTSHDITINFSLNLNDANQAYLYKTLKDWYTLAYNTATGEMGLKKDYVGTIIITNFNRVGDIYRTLTYEECFITSAINLGDNDYSTADAKTIEIIWKSDVAKEELA